MNVRTARRKRNKRNHTTDNKRSNRYYAAYHKQRRRSETYVVTVTPLITLPCLNDPTGNQWRQDLRRRLSPSDPSTNHILLGRAQHEGTATWFFRGSLLEGWKSSGSLLWIHGKRTSSNPSSFHSLM